MSTRPENVSVSVSVSEYTKIEPCLSVGPCIENFVVEDNNSVPNGQSSAMDSTADTLNYNHVQCKYCTFFTSWVFLRI